LISSGVIGIVSTFVVVVTVTVTVTFPRRLRINLGHTGCQGPVFLGGIGAKRLVGIFGERVREARRRKDWSQKDLAEAIGLKAEDSVGAWETRGVEPREPVKRAAATALGVPYEWLVGEAERIEVSQPAPSRIAEDRRFYNYTGKRLPPKAYDLVYSYIGKLEAAGFGPDEINEAEQFLLNGAFNKINAREPAEKSDDDFVLDIKAAWQFVRDVAARGGRKL
jgi:transcriptional regulator with XRE-family HTH domain